MNYELEIMWQGAVVKEWKRFLGIFEKGLKKIANKPKLGHRLSCCTILPG
jgi:hypothetical protein